MALETKKTLEEFDVRSWRGLAALLAYVRKQNLAPDEYALLRDDVTAYSQSGGTDASLRTRIEKVLANITSSDASAVAESESVHEASASPAIENVQAEPEPEKLLSLDEARARILFIKHDIHEMIGNPLSLVGHHKVLGSEYMQTLLEASRATMGGAGGSIQPAMRKLEDVYERLKFAISSGVDETIPEPELEPEPEIVIAPEPIPVAISEVAQDQTVDALRSRLKELEYSLATEKKEKEKDEETKIPQLEQEIEPEPILDTEPSPEPETEPEPVPEPSPVVSPEKKKEPDQAPIIPEKKIPPTQPLCGVITPSMSRMEEEIKRSDVTDGLSNLLDEWEIFRGSFFHRDDRGILNPLYLTLKDLPMSNVMAGRFEGAKTNVVISINDYVNAWRFEQAIEYLPMETFEHYLRRVINKILLRTRK